MSSHKAHIPAVREVLRGAQRTANGAIELVRCLQHLPRLHRQLGALHRRDPCDQVCFALCRQERLWARTTTLARLAVFDVGEAALDRAARDTGGGDNNGDLLTAEHSCDRCTQFGL